MKLSTSLFFILVLLAQTSNDDINSFLSWFASNLSSWLLPLVLMICVLMFFFAILKAPLDVLKKRAVTLTATLTMLAQTDIITNLSSTFFSLLGLLIMIVLPLILILMLYKAFIALIKV